MTREDVPRRSRFEDAAAGVTVPEGVQAAWNGAAPELSTGQIWRARWRDEVQIVVILSPDQRTTVLPLSFDLAYADTTSTCVATEANPFGVPIVTWPSLVRSVPNVVFDRFAGQLDSEVTESLLVGNFGTGNASRSTPHPVLVYRAFIEDAMSEFSNAQWYENGSGELGALLRSSKLKVQEVAEILELTPQRALAIWRGQVPLTYEEAQKIAPVLGESVGKILAANPTPPSDLIGCLGHSRRHHQVLTYAVQQGADISRAYRDLAYQTWALAARQTGEKATNWDLRLDTLFAAVLDEH